MKKQKIISKVLLAGALLPITSLAFINTSCAEEDIEKLFFDVHTKELDITFCDRGASIYSIKQNNKFITYHPQDKNVFLQNDNYYGKTLGRIAGRIKDGKLDFHDRTYQLEVNEVKDDGQTQKNNSLHGGIHSLTSKNFEHTISESRDWYTVSFHYTSPAGEAGYPETLDTNFVYTIYKEINKIELYITATSSGPTVVNLSTHPFFRLNNTGTILDHTLQIPADNMALYDNMKEETGFTGGQVVVGTKPVQGSPWDFRSAKTIGSMIGEAQSADPVSGGIDHIWKFNDTTNGLHTLTLRSSSNDILTVTTDATGVIMYANCFPKDGQKMNDGELDTQYAAITIEPYTFFKKDSVEEDLEITPEKPFSRYISYELGHE